MNSTNSTENVEAVVFKSDGYIAAGILCLTVLAVFLGSLYLCYNKKLLGIRENRSVSLIMPACLWVYSSAILRNVRCSAD